MKTVELTKVSNSAVATDMVSAQVYHYVYSSVQSTVSREMFQKMSIVEGFRTNQCCDLNMHAKVFWRVTHLNGAISDDFENKNTVIAHARPDLISSPEKITIPPINLTIIQEPHHMCSAGGSHLHHRVPSVWPAALHHVIS
ncbi:hypothetical protein ANCDUO_10314 [Ancylostoma duodenale]|uniref:Uncharacterized protein n=1 Tax=Ancylostoma duodenale TaxID=51022 RepID=A0A0C2DAT5_9BILA|nr:hypothetical protein ANCDUO_10314 [Ancylostoma duodenale]